MSNGYRTRARAQLKLNQVMRCAICDVSDDQHEPSCPQGRIEALESAKKNIRCAECGTFAVDVNTSDWFECRECHTQYSRTMPHTVGINGEAYLDVPGEDDLIFVYVLDKPGKGEIKVDITIGQYQKMIDDYQAAKKRQKEINKNTPGQYVVLCEEIREALWYNSSDAIIDYDNIRSTVRKFLFKYVACQDDGEQVALNYLSHIFVSSLKKLKYDQLQNRIRRESDPNQKDSLSMRQLDLIRDAMQEFSDSNQKADNLSRDFQKKLLSALQCKETPIESESVVVHNFTPDDEIILGLVQVSKGKNVKVLRWVPIDEQNYSAEIPGGVGHGSTVIAPQRDITVHVDFQYL